MASDAASPSFEPPMGGSSLRLPAAGTRVPARPADAPALPAQREGLRTPSGPLNPRRQASTAGASLVSTALRSVPAPRAADQHRDLTAWPAAAHATSQRARTPALEPRSMGGQLNDGGAPRRRTVELLAALSGGLDAAEDRAPGHAIRTAILAVRIAESLERTETTRASLLYAGLLRDAGTTGRSAESLGGKAAGKSRHQPAYLSRPDRAAAVIRSLKLPAEVMEAVCSADEQWNGDGPLRLRHDAIPMGARIIAVASVAADAIARSLAAAQRSGQTDLVPPTFRAVQDALQAQRGHRLDPRVVDACIKQIPAVFWRTLVETGLVDQLLEAEPAGDIRRSTPEHIDAVCATFADLVDTRTPLMGRHGVNVAHLAERVASRLGFDELECHELRRAGLLHDIGKLLVPIAYLEKSAELTDAERAVIQDHPRIGAEILRSSRVLEGLASLVEGHHEKLDGTGHFRDFKQPRMALAARILAVCDRYEAMTSERPYRPLLTTAQVWRLLEEAATEPLARQAFMALRASVDGA